MTIIQPTLQTPVPPSLQAMIDLIMVETKKSINCAKVGVVQAWDAADNTVTVKVAFQQVTSVMPDGSKTLSEYPLLLKVPVCFPSGGGFTLTFPIAAGDECLVVFNDRQLDSWFVNGAGLPPETPRLHDLSDGIAFVGIRSTPRALPAINATGAQLRSDDGTTFVEVDDGRVKIHGGTIYQWDCHGYGQRITWTGGNNYTIDNYTIGAVITTNNHLITPPEVI